MNASNPSARYGYPFDLSWTPQDLAEAVPLRLSQLIDFDAMRGNGIAASANAMSFQRTRLMRDYLRNSALSLFRIH